MRKYVGRRKRIVASSGGYSLDWMYDFLINIGISEETINCVLGINGNNEQSYLDILFYFTGYRNFDQLRDDPSYEDLF